MTTKIALVGLAGSGKSTCARLIADYAAERGLTTVWVPLADPLYRLQAQVYAAAGRTLSPGEQDQVLLESIADHLRRLNPRALVDDFLARISLAADADLLLNEDLRDPHVDAPALRASGFLIIRVTCDEELRRIRLKERHDPTLADRSTAEIDLITPDAVIDNSGGLSAYRAIVYETFRACL